jgi:hypothetical protein
VSVEQQLDSLRLNYMGRLRAARAVGKFLGDVPKSVNDVITLFETRRYNECKQKCNELLSEGLWVALGQIAVQGCNEILALEPSPATSTKVEVIKR